MEAIFITKIHINKVRHLENIEILLSENEPKHLILTGRNGSGKTSVLEDLVKSLKSIEHNVVVLDIIKQWEELQNKAESEISTFKYHKPQGFEEQVARRENNIANIEKTIKTAQEQYATKNIHLFIDFHKTLKKYQAGEFILAFFDAKRGKYKKTNEEVFTKPKGIEKLEAKEKYGIEEKANTNFIQYLVNLKVERSFARDDNDWETIEKIDAWFENFEKLLKDIFEAESLQLIFDRKNYNFTILQEGKEPFDLNTLSDGYSAILSIITELIMRMEGKVAKIYDMQGIVLIDEIVTHLHPTLQSKIFNFLTHFFPKIQFICTTHSPIVLSNAQNAVFYDLEKNYRTDDLAELSYGSVLEYYYQTPEYALVMIEKMERFEWLCQHVNELHENELEELSKFRIAFKELSPILSTDMRRRYRIANNKISKPQELLKNPNA